MHIQKTILGLRSLKKFNEFRYCTQAIQQKEITDNFMCAWQLNSYGYENKLELIKDAPIPIIEGSKQVLVQVNAASVNPIDMRMMSGFGSVMLKNLRKIDSFKEYELPLILGRDFSGIVVGKGSKVTEVNIGDEVYGVVKPQDQGCHAQYTITDESLVTKKPKFLSMEEASSILYTGLTAWSALKISGGLLISPPKNKKVLVIGGSGGVGIIAIQLLKAWGAQVVTTCNNDAVSLVERFNPDAVIDYSDANFMQSVQSAGGYDIILDAAGLEEDELKDYISSLNKQSSIVTLRSPLLPNIDKYGLVCGTLKSVIDLAVPNVTTGIVKNCSLIKWGFFTPSATAVDEIANLVSNGQIRTVIEQVYDFSDASSAYVRMKNGHLRGKIVISMNEASSTA